MIDSVLKGTGNSRFLKSAVPAGTSWADALAMLQAGTFPIDFNGINAEGFQQVGTPLNKANLLKDATAAQIGLPPSTTPDGMFQALGNTGELHVWRKTVTTTEATPEVPAGYTLGTKTNTKIATSASSQASKQPMVQIVYADSVNVDNSGNVSISGNLGWIYVWGGDYGDELDPSAYRGKFIQIRNKQNADFANVELYDIYYVPSNSSVTKGVEFTYGASLYIELQKVTGYPYTPGIPAGTTTTYPVSTNPNAYQEGDDAKAAGYVVGDVVTGKVLASKCYNNTAIYYGKSVSVSDDGIVSILNPTTRTLSSTLSSAEIAAIKDSFVYFSGNENYSDVSSAFRYGNIVYIPADASVSMEYANSAYGVYIDRYQPVTGYAAIPAGTTIEYLGKLGDKARVQVVSYVGMGTYGESNPNSLTFDFAPKVVLFIASVYVNVTNSVGQSNHLFNNYSNIASELTRLLTEPLTTNFLQSAGFGNTSSYAKKSIDGRVITWYNQSGNDYQGNISGRKYYYLGIG